MVINIGAKDGRYEDVQKDIEGVVGAANGKIVKVIIETVLLTDDEKVKASEQKLLVQISLKHQLALLGRRYTRRCEINERHCGRRIRG